MQRSSNIESLSLRLNHVYCGDALEILKRFPNSAIDMVVTDPPYNCRKDYGVYKDNLTEEEYLRWSRKWLKEVYRILNDEGKLYFSISTKFLRQLWELSEKAGFVFDHLLVWYGPNSGAFGGPRIIRGSWAYMWEPILFFRKRKKSTMLRGLGGVLSHDVIVANRPQTNFRQEKRFHVTQKPLKLYITIISRTPGDIVLDPFAGSGSVLVVAKMLGRKYIGIELNPEYVKIIERRLRVPRKITEFGAEPSHGNYKGDLSN